MAKIYIQKTEQYSGLLGKVFDSLENDSTVDAPSIHIVNEALDEKADKIAVLNEDGTEVVKKIDLGFKMLEEEGNITKGQLIDRDTKGVLYPETTTERVIGLDKELDKISNVSLKENNSKQTINLCLNVTDKYMIESTPSEITVSPGMGIKIVESEE